MNERRIVTEVSTKRYIGTRSKEYGLIVMVHEPGNPHSLPTRTDLVNHSPDGFEWGYGGSGPAQLALAILADATGDDNFARKHHQKFKCDFVIKFPFSSWAMTVEAVDAWVRMIKAEEAA